MEDIFFGQVAALVATTVEHVIAPDVRDSVQKSTLKYWRNFSIILRFHRKPRKVELNHHILMMMSCHTLPKRVLSQSMMIEEMVNRGHPKMNTARMKGTLSKHMRQFVL